jgi:hypothetical protein
MQESSSEFFHSKQTSDLPSAASAAVPAPAQGQERPYPWIVHPAADLLFCCGLFPVLVYFLFLAGYRSDPANPVGLVLWALTIIGIHCFQDAHGVASWHRILTHKPTMQSAKRYFIVITVIAALLFLPLLTNNWLLTNCMRLYLLIGLQHWLMQSFGVTLIYCYKRGYILKDGERKVVYLLFQSLAWYSWARFFTVPAYGSLYLNGFTLPFLGPLPVWVMNDALGVFQAIFVIFAVMVIRKYLREKKVIPLPALILIATTIWVYTLTDSWFNLLTFFIGAFYHGSQSWCITTAFHCKAHGLENGITNKTIWKVFFRKSTWGYLFLLFVFSELLYTVAPRLLTHCGISLSVAFATIAVVFSTHHFMCDAAIWKLRDPAMRKLLIS